MSAAYFRRLELTRHVTLVTNYVSKNVETDHALQPYLRISPILPANPAATAPTKINARLSVDEDGMVKQVDLEGEISGQVRTELERALRGWLFLPKLSKGKPVATKAVVPLQLKL